jgi:hypothetical protein
MLAALNPEHTTGFTGIRINLFTFWNAFIERVNGGFIAAAFINRHFVWPSIFFESLFKESFSGYDVKSGS